MGNWDRVALIVVGLLMSACTGWQGRRFWQRRQWLQCAGVALLMLAATGVPVLLLLFAT